MPSRYQAWLKHVFDHPVKEPKWYLARDAFKFEASAIELIELIGQTLLRAGKDLTKYSDAKVDQGIWYLASSCGSNFMFALAAKEVPVRKRVEAIESIFLLYSNCYAKRCAKTLGHLSEKGSPLNASCYMFWDLCLHPNLENMLKRRETRQSVLSVLKKTLGIEHRACREGALHGLGHIAKIYPESVREIIDGFLRRNKLDNKLLAYALKAREGKVL